jgi:hypothetical protein
VRNEDANEVVGENGEMIDCFFGGHARRLEFGSKRGNQFGEERVLAAGRNKAGARAHLRSVCGTA